MANQYIINIQRLHYSVFRQEKENAPPTFWEVITFKTLVHTVNRLFGEAEEWLIPAPLKYFFVNTMKFSSIVTRKSRSPRRFELDTKWSAIGTTLRCTCMEKHWFSWILCSKSAWTLMIQSARFASFHHKVNFASTSSTQLSGFFDAVIYACFLNVDIFRDRCMFLQRIERCFCFVKKSCFSKYP